MDSICEHVPQCTSQDVCVYTGPCCAEEATRPVWVTCNRLLGIISNSSHYTKIQ